VETKDLIETFYDVCHRQFAPFMLPVVPDDPAEMLVGTPTSSNWIEWKLLFRSTGIDPAFATFEQEMGVVFPHMFKLWHSRYFTLDGGIGGVGENAVISGIYLPAIPSNDPFGPLRFEMTEMDFPEKQRARGFVPFASAWDVGPLCFDTSADVKDADWPIYIWDHEDEDDIHIVFSSFRKLLECCIYNCGRMPPGYTRLPPGKEGMKSIDPTGYGLYADMMQRRFEAWEKRNQQ
jgi:hypothetical protein